MFALPRGIKAAPESQLWASTRNAPVGSALADVERQLAPFANHVRQGGPYDNWRFGRAMRASWIWAVRPKELDPTANG
jgi:hypothetical protein